MTWISVKDSLPPLDTKVLVCWRSPNYPDIVIAEVWTHWGWRGTDEHGFCPDPDYWMPLPKHPRDAT